MTISYDAFLDAKTSIGGDHGFEPTFIPDRAFDFQSALIQWATKKGRAAIFADCGMGKSLMQLAWAENVVRHTNKHVLILTPLAVGAQMVKEAEKFGVTACRSLDGKFPQSPQVVIANYERLHLFTPQDFSGVVCDESSILKNFSGATKTAVSRFMNKHQFRLLCTATAAPNDFIELGTSSEALGYLPHMDMLKMFFKNDTNTYAAGGNNGGGARRWAGEQMFGGKWRFRGHAERDFWRWVVSWSRAIRKPSDLGFDDRTMTLPPLNMIEHTIKSETPPDGMLFSMPAIGLDEQRKERSRTLEERCEYAAGLTANTGQPAILWCHGVAESKLLKRLTPDAVEVSGDDEDEEKEEKFEAFQTGQARCIVTKPSIAGFGLNWQHCNHQTFFPSHSFEQLYQAVRRCWRFGQLRPVTVDIVASEGEIGVVKNLQRKAHQADEMFANLVSLMGNELHLERKEKERAQVTIPSFI